MTVSEPPSSLDLGLMLLSLLPVRANTGPAVPQACRLILELGLGADLFSKSLFNSKDGNC